MRNARGRRTGVRGLSIERHNNQLKAGDGDGDSDNDDENDDGDGDGDWSVGAMASFAD